MQAADFLLRFALISSVAAAVEYEDAWKITGKVVLLMMMSRRKEGDKHHPSSFSSSSSFSCSLFLVIFWWWWEVDSLHITFYFPGRQFLSQRRRRDIVPSFTHSVFDSHTHTHVLYLLEKRYKERKKTTCLVQITSS